MTSRNLFFFSDPGHLTGFGADEPDYWNDPEIIVDPVSCMVVAILPRSEEPFPKPQPRRPRRRRNGFSLWRATIARWLASGERPDIHSASEDVVGQKNQ